jgi:hypothetical protein
MRLAMLIVGDPTSLPACLARGLSDAPCELQSVVIERPRPSVWSRATRLLVPERAFAEFNARVISEVANGRPDVVWIFKGMEVYPETLRSLREQGIMLVNYNADHPFLHFSRGSGNRNVSRAIPEYHLHLTYSKRIASELGERQPGTQVAVVPFGHDVSDTMFERINKEEEVVKACFLGTPDADRARNVMRLVEAGIPVDVYGCQWDRFLSASPLLRTYGEVAGEDMLRTLRRYRVQLNFFRPHNRDSHNMRSFEVPACGGIMLAEDSSEHRTFFECGREAWFFNSPQEMIGLTRHLLALPKPKADAVRLAARLRSVGSGYSYRHRALAAFAEIQKVFVGHLQ